MCASAARHAHSGESQGGGGGGRGGGEREGEVEGMRGKKNGVETVAMDTS